MKYVGRHKILVFLSSYLSANLMVEKINNGNGPLRAYVPQHLVCITGVVADIPAELEVDEIRKDLDCDVPIMDVQRMTKREENGDRIPINRIIITFRARQLPDKVCLFCCISRVSPFVPRVVLCLKCLRFGHRRGNCKGVKRCESCTLRHDDEADYKNCKNIQKSAHCRSSDHNSADEACPERKGRWILSLMSRQNLTYTEANQQVTLVNVDSEEFPQLTESFANMTKGRYNWKDPMKEQLINTNEERKAIQAAVKINKEQKSIGNKRPRVEEKGKLKSTTAQRNALITNTQSLSLNGTDMYNPHSVTEKERWEGMLKEAQVQSKKMLQESMISFYSDFIGMLGPQGDTKNMFKQCTEKHFKLANTVVLNNPHNIAF
ncbi:uncharacterized protein LOC131686781 [Topomyia yanbarensis]|uniref:uncharacterized protein LOC131686781 n=1 Tax=Topomyia yanbarensis TaxID=2498891 RepID=UPI00273C0A13|nr:uncharacterized protein LOC131686781 [Topomyia yanbarensis]XP_058826768.1 uncharacterized protein LOC131686781 [Topomyia yanbarensis]XP_058826774.1 uncharacterized protein LOC131686781 [Topomyia yanbarensis]